MQSNSLVAPTCLVANTIGWYCNVPSTACDTLRPCQNQGNCTNTNATSSSYVCSCPTDFGGASCQFDHRPCRADTCWNNGTCTQTSQTTARCVCVLGWRGLRCETLVDYCANVTCQNNGVCRGSLLNYKCECLGETFSGRHCEIKSSATVVHQAVARSFAFIAIIVLGATVGFIVLLDVLKYVFGVDPVGEERRKLVDKKLRQPAIAVRFVYVN